MLESIGNSPCQALLCWDLDISVESERLIKRQCWLDLEEGRFVGLVECGGEKHACLGHLLLKIFHRIMFWLSWMEPSISWYKLVWAVWSYSQVEMIRCKTVRLLSSEFWAVSFRYKYKTYEKRIFNKRDIVTQYVDGRMIPLSSQWV